MEKRVWICVLSLVFFLALLILVEASSTDSCEKPADYCKNKVDYFSNSYNLVEYFCDGDFADFTEKKCEYKCLDGKCVKKGIIREIFEGFEYWFDWVFGYEEPIDSEIKDVDGKIKSCIRKSLIDSLIVVGMQGGLLSPEDYIITKSSVIAYGYNDGNKKLVSKKEIEEDLEDFIELGFYGCIDEINENIIVNKLKTDVRVKDNEVYVAVKEKIDVEKGESEFKLNKKYEIDVSIRLGEMHKVAGKIIREKEKPELADLTYLTDYGFDIMVTDYDDIDVVVYSIIDEDTQVNELPNVFRFAVGY